jgi:hypothetical protein
MTLKQQHGFRRKAWAMTLKQQHGFRQKVSVLVPGMGRLADASAGPRSPRVAAADSMLAIVYASRHACHKAVQGALGTC